MSAAQLDALVLAAQKRLAAHMNRVCSQQIRRMLEGWRKAA